MDESSNSVGVGSFIGQKFRMEEKLGQGSFGMIFRCVNIESQESHAMKLEKRRARQTSMLVREIKVMIELKNEFGYARMISYGKDDTYNYVVMTSLGKNLDNLLKKCGQRFSLATCMNIADQMLSRLEILHSHSLIHRDIKPENFVIGSDRSFHLVYLIDFGLAKYYRDQEGSHIPQVEKKGMIGTARYASINAHLGIEQSRRDDLEALGYVLLYFIRGRLPWQHIIADTKEEKYEKIKNIKMNCPLEQLCEGCPNELVQYLRYVRKLEFTEQPNYSLLKGYFKKVIADRKLDILATSVDWETLADYRHRKKLIMPTTVNTNDTNRLKSQPVVASPSSQSAKILMPVSYGAVDLQNAMPQTAQLQVGDANNNKNSKGNSPPARTAEAGRLPAAAGVSTSAVGAAPVSSNSQISPQMIGLLTPQQQQQQQSSLSAHLVQGETSHNMNHNSKEKLGSQTIIREASVSIVMNNNIHNNNNNNLNNHNAVNTNIAQQQSMANTHSPSILNNFLANQNHSNNNNSSHPNSPVNSHQQMPLGNNYPLSNAPNNNNGSIATFNMEKRNSLLQTPLAATTTNNLLNVPSKDLLSLSVASLTATSKINNYSASEEDGSADTISEEGGIQISTQNNMIDRNHSPMSTSDIKKDIKIKSIVAIRQSQLHLDEVEQHQNQNGSGQLGTPDVANKQQQDSLQQEQRLEQVEQLQQQQQQQQSTQQLGNSMNLLSRKSLLNDAAKNMYISGYQNTSQQFTSTDEIIREHLDDENNNSKTNNFKVYRTQISPITEAKESTMKSKTSKASFIGENITESMYEKQPILINVMQVHRAFQKG